MKLAGRVWLGAAAYAAVYFALGALRYTSYRSGSDVGLFTQSIATVFHGFANTPERGSHFTFHFSPILYLCAPLLLATHSALALVATQAVAGALAAPPLFYIARKRVSAGLAAGVASVALVYPPLAGVTFTDFHENGFATAATLWLLWAVDARKWFWAVAFLCLTLGIKEDQAPIVAFAALAALAYFLRRGDRVSATFAGAAFLTAAATFVTFFTLVRPAAGATDMWGPTHFYVWSHVVDPRGSTPWYSFGRPAYFLEAFVPLGFAALASPAIVLALPGFAEVLGSHESITYTMGQHYAAVWIGYVLFAFALAIARIDARSHRIATVFARTSVVLCVLVLAFASPTHWGHYVHLRDAHDAALDRALAGLPKDLAVGASDEQYAHLGFDPHALLGFDRLPPFALIDTKRPSFLNTTWPRSAAAGNYRLVWRDDGIELYERRGGTAATSAKSAVDGRGSGVARARALDRRALAGSRRDE